MNEDLIEYCKKNEKFDYLKKNNIMGYYIFVELLYGTIQDAGKVYIGSEKYYGILSKIAKYYNNSLNEEKFNNQLNLLIVLGLIKKEENLLSINNFSGYIEI